jgi:CheY-like chemotaxis protein
MASSTPVLDTVAAPDHPPPEAPFTAWPDPDRGFMVLNLRTMAWAAGPFPTAAEAVEAMDRLNEQAAARTGARGPVLVVDDDEATVEFLAVALEQAGYGVLSAVGGGALRLATERHPAVILLDLMMPGMDGVEVGRRLRADPATADIPIVAMSAVERLHARGRSMPMDDRLAKPFDLAQLYETVGRWAATA